MDVLLSFTVDSLSLDTERTFKPVLNIPALSTLKGKY